MKTIQSTQHYNLYFKGVFLILFGGLLLNTVACSSNPTPKVEAPISDKLANGLIENKMSKRYYFLQVKTLSQTVSDSFSTKTKLENDLQRVLGKIINVETGHQVVPGQGEINICKLKVENGKSFTNTYKYIGTDYTLWLTAHVEELKHQGNLVQLLITATSTKLGDNQLVDLSPEATKSIYNKLWSTIESEFY